MKAQAFFNWIYRRFSIKSSIALLSILILLLGVFFVPLTRSIDVYQILEQCPKTVDGQILYSPMWTSATFLRDNTGALNHTWSSSHFPGVMVRWLGDGTILRTLRVGSGSGTGGAGGGVQKVQWDGTVEWDFRYRTNQYLSHHDVRALPNGNVLLIAWETKTRTEAIAAGRNPSYVSTQGLMPDHIVEVQPTGPTSGTIVWEWHVWDHLIQDYDSTKANYGLIGDHPELVDINYGTSTQQDWMHTNSIDYNEKFDQILISVCYFSEIWIIDHSTTTEEAAGHTGGNSGNGGDILYRWGNPRVYDAGTSNDQKLFNQHDATWIKAGCPGEENILVFNNGGSRRYSTVDEIVPPVNEDGEYSLTPGSAYGPTTLTWSYSPQPRFYANHLSGAHRLSSGNTLITNGETGKLFEVTPEGATVWQYNTGGQLFKVEIVSPDEQEEPPESDVPKVDCSGSLSWTDIEPAATVTGSFQVQNVGGSNSTLNWTVNTSSISWGNWAFTPISGENLTPNDGLITIEVSIVVPNEGNSEFQGFLRVENQKNSTDFDVIPVYLKTPVTIQTIQMMMYQFVLKWIHLFSGRIMTIFQHLL